MKVTFECSPRQAQAVMDSLRMIRELSVALWDYQETLRGIVKYPAEGQSDQYTKGVEYARSRYYEALDSVDLDELSEVANVVTDISAD